MHDLVIRGGNVVDGSGAATRTADLAIDGDRVTAVGEVDGKGHREVDADGLMVTPGWVDIHTHYDGQATWDPEVSPSGWHGVTSIVMGNCGVGFAPARASDREWLIGLMEGTVVREHDEATGERPGRVVRGPQAGPAKAA